jgi:hypothetical protein
MGDGGGNLALPHKWQLVKNRERQLPANGGKRVAVEKKRNGALR